MNRGITFLLAVLALATAGCGPKAPPPPTVPEKTEAELRKLVAEPRVFFVDPIDGTREFSQGLSEFAVMLGLAIEGSAAAGVLILPAEGLKLAGRVGDAAFLERDEQPGVRVPLAPTKLATPATARVVVSRSHRAKELADILERLGNPYLRGLTA